MREQTLLSLMSYTAFMQKSYLYSFKCTQDWGMPFKKQIKLWKNIFRNKTNHKTFADHIKYIGTRL